MTDPSKTDQPAADQQHETDPETHDESPTQQDPTDKHGEPAINRGRYDRDMAAKDAEIEQLKKQLKEANDKATTGAEALKKVEALEARLADQQITHSLEQAGCLNAKAAKSLLEDYGGDVAKLKESCPYLFGPARQQGSTGAKPQGAPEPTDELVRKAREAAGTAHLYQH